MIIPLALRGSSFGKAVRDRKRFTAVVLAWLLLGGAILTGCAGDANSATAARRRPHLVTITVSPTTATLTAGTTQQFSASVTGTSNTAVTWGVSGAGCSGAACGTISFSGLYTSPANISSSLTVTVQGTSVADPTKSASATVTIVAAVAMLLSISPASASVPTGGTQSLTATETGTSNTAVTWSLSGAGCSGSACGTLSSSSLSAVYTSPSVPPSPPQVSVIATNVADPTKSASATMTIVAAVGVSLSISPTSASVPTGGTQSLTATETGTSNTAVTWSLSGAGCSGSACGTLSTSSLSAVYGAPSVPPSPANVSVMVTSVADPTKSASASITVVPNVAVTVTPGNVSLTVGTTQQFSAAVTGTSNTAVTWTVSGAGCSGAACGTVDSSGRYTAPSAVPTPATVTVTATSSADSTKSGSASVTVAAPSSARINAHPRIWLTPSKLGQLQSQYATNSDYSAMKNVINAYMAAPYGTAASDCTGVDNETAYDFDIAWALVYKVEGIARYGTCAVKMGEQAMVFFCPGGGYGSVGACYNGNAYRSYVIHAVLVFDWTYPLLTSTDKATFVNNLTGAFAYEKANYVPCYNASASETYCTQSGQGVLGNLGAGWVQSDCLIGYGTWGDNPSDSGLSNNQIAQCQQRYTSEFKPTWNSAGTLPPNFSTGAGLGIGGTYIEGSEYGPQVYEYALGMLLAMSTATGADYFADNGTMVQDIVLSALYSTSPSSSKSFGCGPSDSSYFPFSFGDQQSPVGIISDSFRPAMGMASDYLGASNIYAQYANYWLNNIQPADQCSATNYGYRRFYHFFFNTVGKIATDWRSGGSVLPTDRIAKGMQQVSSRSNWSSTGSWVGYTAGSTFNDHAHPTAGGFHFWRKGEMLTQPDIYYSQMDYGCGEHENNVMVNGHGQVIENFAELGNPLLNNFEGGSTYMYVQSDTYPVYEGTFTGYGSPVKMLRDLIYLKPDFIVIWDRLTFNPAVPSKILIHGPWGSTPTSPGQAITISGGIARSQTVGGQWFYVTPLAPASPSFSVMDESQAFTCIGNATPYNVPSGTFTEKRVEISSGTTDSAMQYLTFLEGSDSSTPTATEKVTNGNLIAVHAKNSTDDKVIGFSSSSSGAVITLPVNYSFTAAASTDTHVIANLAPNSTVNVIRSKVGSVVTVTLAPSGTGTNYTTTANGVLCFTSAGNSCGGM